MTALPRPLQHVTTLLLNRLTGAALRAVGYGAEAPVPAASSLGEAQMWAELAGELHLRSIGREA